MSKNTINIVVDSEETGNTSDLLTVGRGYLTKKRPNAIDSADDVDMWFSFADFMRGFGFGLMPYDAYLWVEPSPAYAEGKSSKSAA